MVILRITFLLGLDVREVEKNEITPRMIKKKSSIKKRKSATRSFKSKKSNKSRNSSKSRSKNPKNKKKAAEITEVEEDPVYTAIEVQEPLEYFHIEYQLFPESFKYCADIVCWGPVVKMYSGSDSKCYKTVIKENTIWIPVFVEHSFCQLSAEEVRMFLQHTISFCIKFGKNNVGAPAKADKISRFYVHKETDADFGEVFAERLPSEEGEIKRHMQKILHGMLAFPSPGEILSWIHNTNVAHVRRVLKIISTKVSRGEFNCKSADVDYEKETSEAGKKESKRQISRNDSTRSRNAKGRKPEDQITFNFHIPVCTFVTDPVMATYHVRKAATTKFTDLFVLLGCENLLTYRQKQEINPLIIKIRKISNLPFQLLRDKGFDKIYVRCDIPNLIKFETAMKPVANDVIFEESRLVFTDQISPIKKLEYLQTRRVLFQIFAVNDAKIKEKSQPDQKSVKEKDKTKKATKKETKKGKKKETKKGKKKETEKGKEDEKKTEKPEATDSVLVSLAHFDMSSLSRNYSPFKERLPCHNPRSVFIKPEGTQNEQFLDQFTVNELHAIVPPNMLNPSPLKENFLIACDTTLKLEAYFLSPQYPSFDTESVTYKRFMIIVFEEEAAKLILNSILAHNHEKLERSGPIFFPNICTRKVSDSNLNPLEGNLLTGFLIDDGNCFMYFVEGPSNGFILSLLHQVSSYSYSTAKVFYNSEYLFEERLYTIFTKLNGFLMITLKFPLCDIFRRQEIYIVGNVPLPCFQAIQKLLLIFKSKTFKTILSYNILPTETELISLSIEFGLQVKYKNKDSDSNLTGKNEFTSSSGIDLFKIPH